MKYVVYSVLSFIFFVQLVIIYLGKYLIMFVYTMLQICGQIIVLKLLSKYFPVFKVDCFTILSVLAMCLRELQRDNCLSYYLSNARSLCLYELLF